MSTVLPIEEDKRWREHTASACQKQFPIPYPFQDAADIRVERIGLDGFVTILTNPDDYTVSGAGSPSGGHYKLKVPAAAGEIFRSIGLATSDRTGTVVESGRFSSRAIDDEFDRNAIRDMELRRDVDRALKADFGTTGPVIRGWEAGALIMWLDEKTWVPGPNGAAIAGAAAAAEAAVATVPVITGARADAMAAAAIAQGVAAALGMRNTAQGRLSLASAAAVPSVDVATSNTIYYLPAGGSLAPVFNGTVFAWHNFAPGLSVQLDPNPAHDGYHAVNFIYDLFYYFDGAELRLGTGPTWGSGAVPSPDVTVQRATGPGSSELTKREGIIVNRYEMHLRTGPNAVDQVTLPPNQATYAGSFKATANGQATDTRRQRLLFNAYNQVPRVLTRLEDAAEWEYSLVGDPSGFRKMNNSLLNRVEVLFGLEGSIVDLSLKAIVRNDSLGTVYKTVTCYAAVGVDSETFPTGAFPFAVPEAIASASGRVSLSTGMGFHYFCMLEQGAGVNGPLQYWKAGCELTGQVLL